MMPGLELVMTLRVEIATLRAIGQAHGFATITELVPSARLITQAAANLLGYALRSSR